MVILIPYLNIDNIIKKSKGRCKKSAPACAEAEPISPGHRGKHWGFITTQPGDNPPNRTEKSRAHVHITLFVPVKRDTYLSRAILDSLHTYWLLALLLRAISSSKI